MYILSKYQCSTSLPNIRVIYILSKYMTGLHSFQILSNIRLIYIPSLPTIRLTYIPTNFDILLKVDRKTDPCCLQIHIVWGLLQLERAIISCTIELDVQFLIFGTFIRFAIKNPEQINSNLTNVEDAK